MAKQFNELKQQLAELSETINKFESEAVQLRIVELVFDQARGKAGGGFSEPEAASYEAEPAPARGRRGGGTGTRARSSTPVEKSRSRNAIPSASGAVSALSKLLEGDYFNQQRTIGEIVKHCQDEFGVRYKSNAFSGPLSRYAKKGVLKREKNADANFVYSK